MTPHRFRVRTEGLVENVDGWRSVSLVRSAATDEAAEGRSALEGTLSGLLQCENLMVLCGLGTSLCIRKQDDPKRSPFPTMRGLWKAVADRVGEAQLESVRKRVSQVGGENIEDLLSRCQMALSLEAAPSEQASDHKSESPDLRAFVTTAETAIRNSMTAALSDEQLADHVAFLRRLVSRPPRLPRVELFTTNYDLCFELAAARLGLPVLDGFSLGAPHRFHAETFDYDIVTTSSYAKEPDFIPHLLRLYKLHGSVNWHRGENFVEKRDTPENPALIYPQVGKYAMSYSPPFLELMSRFQSALRRRNLGVLIVCCGLNDLHVAEPVLSAISSNPGLRMVICAPDLCHEDAAALTEGAPSAPVLASNRVLSHVAQLISAGDARLTLLSATLPGLLRLMPPQPSPTESEQHAARLSQAHGRPDGSR